jgi:hypothetical protein
MKDKLIIGFILILAIIHFGMLISKGPWITEKNLKEIREYEYNRGYTDYQIDTYIPAPFFERKHTSQKPNPRLKEKFKG